ncbi:hypothetical protein GALMADRAFT_148577 [Galerina marginata CBS 339.88]|uniref:Uncharacterized protein n=1 Tax=Galerina marginata (strain CBS 339.88) TaxID=685588 RepID=A0A067SFP8_GALM3|nr:hypothetical protein GALMADRAFT_148577 [Galerina marginata CBS 339.88]
MDADDAVEQQPASNSWVKGLSLLSSRKGNEVVQSSLYLVPQSPQPQSSTSWQQTIPLGFRDRPQSQEVRADQVGSQYGQPTLPRMQSLPEEREPRSPNRSGGEEEDDFLSDTPADERRREHSIEYPGFGQQLEDIQQSILQALQQGFSEVAAGFNAALGSMLPATAPPPTSIASATSPRRAQRRPRLTAYPVRRPHQLREKHKLIREHFRRLMGSHGFIDNASAKEFAERWKADKNLQCCPANSFKIDVVGTSRSPWNTSASRVFALDFLAFHQIQPEPTVLQETLGLAKTRIGSIRYSVKRKEHLNLSAERRKGRKSTLFYRRLDTCSVHPDLQKHLEFVQELGIAGMSSDESDYEEVGRNTATLARTRAPRYRVLRPKWRNIQVGEWLETIDIVGFIMRRNGPKKQGGYPRIRTQSGIISKYSTSDSFVPGLAVNTYDQTWLADRADADFVIFPRPESYRLVHAASTIRYVQSAVTGGSRS